MSRLDYLTIGIVILCVVALGFLVYRTIGLMNAPTSSQQTTQTESNETPTSYEDDGYTYDDEGEIVSDNAAQPTSNDMDLDDEDVQTYSEDEIANEPIDTETDDRIEEKPTSVEENDFVDSDASGVGDYLVLAGSYRIRSNAESEVRRLKNMGYSNARVALFNNGAYAGVLVDRFEAVGDANALSKELKGKRVEAYVQKKRGSR